MLLYLSAQTIGIHVILTLCNFDGTHVEKYVESMLNIYYPFIKPSSSTTAMT